MRRILKKGRLLTELFLTAAVIAACSGRSCTLYCSCILSVTYKEKRYVPLWLFQLKENKSLMF